MAAFGGKVPYVLKEMVTKWKQFFQASGAALVPETRNATVDAVVAASDEKVMKIYTDDDDNCHGGSAV